MVDISEQGDGSLLLILIMQNSQPFFIFGQPAMQNYYMTFSMENSTMTVIPNAWTTKTTLQLGTIPSESISSLKPKNSLLVQLLGIAFLAGMIALYYYVIGPYVNKKVTNQTYIYTIQIVYMISVGCLYYFVVVPLLGGQGSELSLSQVAGIIGTIGGSTMKLFAFGLFGFVGSKILKSNLTDSRVSSKTEQTE